MGSGISRKALQTYFFEEESRDVFEIVYVLAMDGYPHGDRKIIALEVLYPVHRLSEAAPAPARIMRYRDGAIDRYLHAVAPFS